MATQPLTVGGSRYRTEMGDPKVKEVLWANVRALMVHKYGDENLTRLAHDAKIGPGTATRIKKADTSVGLDVLEKVAKSFGVEPWHLLVPGMEPANPPALRPLTQAERDLYKKIVAAARDLSKFQPD
jgi:hypothetical protein